MFSCLVLVDRREISGFRQAGVLAGEHSPGRGSRCWGPHKGDMFYRNQGGGGDPRQHGVSVIR